MSETITDDVTELDDADDAGNGGQRTNNRSSIAFPYTHLGDAEQVAEALQARGQSATMAQLAAQLGTTVKSGAFRMKVATARVFGVIDSSRSQVSLTELGRRIIDPNQRDQARVEAFLHVPLFEAIYKQYDGTMLPPPQGLEAAMEHLGVSPKQTDRARQTLQRSAERAGFFRSGRDRLVTPVLSATSAQDAKVDKPKRQHTETHGDLPPWAAQMWLTLLTEGESWSAEQVKSYIDGARLAFRAQG